MNIEKSKETVLFEVESVYRSCIEKIFSKKAGGKRVQALQR
jgi:hypothetical protein